MEKEKQIELLTERIVENKAKIEQCKSLIQEDENSIAALLAERQVGERIVIKGCVYEITKLELRYDNFEVHYSVQRVKKDGTFAVEDSEVFPRK